jgi:hypothetical protein
VQPAARPRSRQRSPKRPMSKVSRDVELVVRSPHQRLLVGIIVAITLLAMVISFVPALMEPHTQGSASVRALGIMIACAMFFGFAAFGISVMRRGVLVYPDGISVRNLRRSRRLMWDEIDRFSVEPLAASTGRVHLHNGEVLRIWGIQAPLPSWFPNSVEATAPIAQLNALLQQRRSTP